MANGKMEEWISHRLGTLLLIINVIYASVVSLGFGDIPEKIPKIILGLLASFILYVVFRLFNIEKSTHDLVKEIKKMRKGVDVLPFKNQAELYDHIVKKLRGAKKSVDDISWASEQTLGLKTKDDLEAYEHYLAAVKEVCEKKNIYYREVSRIADDYYHSKRVKPLMNEKYYGYNLRYYDIPVHGVTLMSYLIIDSEEVLLGFFRGTSASASSRGEVYFSISQPNIVEYFKSYFETLWNGTDKVIKEGGTIDKDLLDKIKEKDPVYLFSIDVVKLMEENLNKCVITDELKRIFETKNHQLYDNATVRNVKADEWEIIDEKQIYVIKKEEGKLNIYELFSIDTKFEEELNAGRISEELKAKFTDKGFQLPDAAVRKDKKEKKWVITDGGKFIIRKEDGKLKVRKREM